MFKFIGFTALLLLGLFLAGVTPAAVKGRLDAAAHQADVNALHADSDWG